MGRAASGEMGSSGATDDGGIRAGHAREGEIWSSQSLQQRSGEGGGDADRVLEQAGMVRGRRSIRTPVGSIFVALHGVVALEFGVITGR